LFRHDELDYTWHNPRIDADAAEMAGQMGDIFLQGICCAKRAGRQKRRSQLRI